ncbi:hypothetical protein HPB47_021290 [Ixodes persulcatus]|uniref:Uncharacterized protein n=1 Tax=Ixodes persulcatus TaxID=34615 RepID=A0AC60QCY3_IXOPE|nr:hypothetical protein HPB47_021290 [Ixodes persulcatus]
MRRKPTGRPWAADSRRLVIARGEDGFLPDARAEPSATTDGPWLPARGRPGVRAPSAAGASFPVAAKDRQGRPVRRCPTGPLSFPGQGRPAAPDKGKAGRSDSRPREADGRRGTGPPDSRAARSQGYRNNPHPVDCARWAASGLCN